MLVEEQILEWLSENSGSFEKYDPVTGEIQFDSGAGMMVLEHVFGGEITDDQDPTDIIFPLLDHFITQNY
tara:strand:- start:297 stop:506 length:210 start_codon:yes stop_codon:yes gene_type:complete